MKLQATRLQVAKKILAENDGKIPLLDVEDIFEVTRADLDNAEEVGVLKFEGEYLIVNFDLKT